jgi:hypothetical protein
MSKNTLHLNNMLTISTNWGPYKTFKLMPITMDCPYVEAIFDPSSKILAVISKINKSSYHTIPKLDDNGDEITMKISSRANGKKIKEQRVLIDTYAEYYITDLNEIKLFIDMFAIKNDYDYDKIINSDVQEMEKPLSSKKATNLHIA